MQDLILLPGTANRTHAIEQAIRSGRSALLTLSNVTSEADVTFENIEKEQQWTLTRILVPITEKQDATND